MAEQNDHHWAEAFSEFKSWERLRKFIAPAMILLALGEGIGTTYAVVESHEAEREAVMALTARTTGNSRIEREERRDDVEREFETATPVTIGPRQALAFCACWTAERAIACPANRMCDDNAAWQCQQHHPGFRCAPWGTESEANQPAIAVKP